MARFTGLGVGASWSAVALQAPIPKQGVGLPLTISFSPPWNRGRNNMVRYYQDSFQRSQYPSIVPNTHLMVAAGSLTRKSFQMPKSRSGSKNSMINTDPPILITTL